MERGKLGLFMMHWKTFIASLIIFKRQLSGETGLSGVVFLLIYLCVCMCVCISCVMGEKGKGHNKSRSVIQVQYGSFCLV